MIRLVEGAIGAAFLGGLGVAVTPLIPTTVTAENFELWPFITQHPFLVAGIALSAVLILFVLLLLHSFTSAGNAAVYVAGERAALTAYAMASDVSLYRAFEWRSWLAAARNGFWRVAGVYVTAFAIVMLPFGVVFCLAMAAQAGGQGFFGCLVLVVVFPVLLAAVIGVVICTPKAVIITTATAFSPRDSLRLAFAQTASSLGAHLWAILVVGILTGLAGSVLTGSGELDFGISLEWPYVSADPAQWIEQVLKAVSGCWLFAIMAALTDLRDIETSLLDL